MTMPRAALLLALALPMAGCTKLFDTASLDPLGTAAGYCRARYDAHYTLAVACWGYDPQWASVRPKSWYQEDCDRIASSVASGRMTYDRAAGEACLAAYQVPACTAAEPLYTLPACAVALAPAVRQGGACTRDKECLSPGWCGSLDGTCPGHCVGFGALGDACDAASGPCGPGLWCDGASTCAPRQGSGQPCADNCLENLSCSGGFCSYVAGLGESCATLPCDPARAIYCAAGTCLATPQGGEACGVGGRCGAGLYCNASTRCAPVPTDPRLDGQDCHSPLFCGPGSFCDATTNLCTPRKQVGGDCSSDVECVMPAHCQVESGLPNAWTCRSPAVAGTQCLPGTCAVGAWCHVTSGAAGTCATEPDMGQPCGQIGIGDYASCNYGFCALASPSDLTGVCQPSRAPGAACTDDYQCESYSCDPAAGTCRPLACPIP